MPVTEALRSSEQSLQELQQCQTALMPFPVMWILLSRLLDTSQIQLPAEVIQKYITSVCFQFSLRPGQLVNKFRSLIKIAHWKLSLDLNTAWRGSGTFIKKQSKLGIRVRNKILYLFDGSQGLKCARSGNFWRSLSFPFLLLVYCERCYTRTAGNICSRKQRADSFPS